MLACALVGPFTFATGLQSSALKLALACSGAAAEETIVESYSVVKAEGVSELPVAEDGFFLLRVIGKFAYPDEPETSITVEVRDATDAKVAGSLHSFDRDLLAWTADSKLAAGLYQATVSAASNPMLPPAQLELRSSGPREQLRAARLVEGDWLTQRAFADGPIAVCGSPTDCGGGSPSFHEREASFRSVDLQVQAPDLTSSVYWEMSIYPVAGKGSFQQQFWEASKPMALFFPGQALPMKLVFADELEEYCVTVHAVDRRDGTTLQSPPQCWKPKAPVRVDEDEAALDELRRCDAPPSPALAARWCSVQPDPSRLPECQGRPDADGAGSGGDAAGSAGSGDDPHPGGSSGRGNFVGDDIDPPDESSSACSIGHSRRPFDLGLAALLALAALGVRRRVTRS